MRVYLPATLELLDRWHAAGGAPSSQDAFVAADDSEEGEYDALMSAADASATLVVGQGRRVVLVAEIASDGAVPVRCWVAVHADTADRPPGADPDEDLGWFGVQEISTLLAP